MKYHRTIQPWLNSLVLGCALVTSALTGRGQNFVLDFATNSIWSTNTGAATYKWWGGCSTVQEFATNDVANDPTSGSVKFTITWPNPAGQGDFQYAVGMSLSGISGGGDIAVSLPAISYTNMEMDILWDTNASTASVVDHQAGGDPAGFGVNFVATQWGQTWVPAANQPVLVGNGSWEHFTIPIDIGWPNIPGMLFKKWRPNDNAGATNMAGQVSVFYVDNIKFNYNTNQVIPKPTGRFEHAVKGLNITAAKSGDQYQRESVRSIAAETVQWFGNANPVTYSWTIGGFPSRAEAPGYFGTLFLAPDGNGNKTPDWDNANCIVVETSVNGNGEGTCNFRFKTNAPTSNGVLYGTGLLGQLINPSGVLGTWSVTFTNNSHVTVVGPSGGGTNFDMGADAAAFFQTTTPLMQTYFGFQPGGAANIGNRGVYTRLKIQNGATTVVDDTFPGPDLDANLWVTAFQAADAVAYKVVDQDAGYWFSWNKPDGFYSFIGISSNVTSGWVDSGLTTLDLGARTGSFVDTNVLANFPRSVHLRLYGTNTP